MTAIILAGGKASRMSGCNKAFLKIGQGRIIDCQLSVLKKIFKKIIIVTNLPKRYGEFEGVKVISDIIPNCGPLGGIYSGLLASSTFYNFVVACDMPALDEPLISYMLERIEDFDALVPEYAGRLHCLCALYSKNCLPTIKEQLEKKDFTLRNFLKLIKMRKLAEAEIRQFDSSGESFANINTDEHYQSYSQNS